MSAAHAGTGDAGLASSFLHFFRELLFPYYIWTSIFYIPITYIAAYALTLLTNILLYVFLGEGYRVPCLFIYFLLVVFIEVYILYIATRTFFAVEKGNRTGKQKDTQKGPHEILRAIALFLAWAGTVFTLKDLIKYLLQLFGIKLDI